MAQVYELVAVVRDVHQPTMSSTASITIYIMDANDHAPVWIVPSNVNTTVIRVSSYTAVGTPVARVRAEDADADDNARLTYSTSAGVNQDHVLDDHVLDDHVLDDLPFDVDPDTGIIRLRSDLSATVGPQF